MKRSKLAALGVCVLLSAPAPLAAAEEGHEKCAATFDQCLNDCDTQHKGDAAGRAACVPTCSGKYAACDAGVAYDKAKPWIEKQAEKTKKFMEDLMENLKKDPPPEDPQSKDKSI